MEVIAAFFFVFMVFAFAVIFALILGYASRAHSAEARANKLQGALESAWRAYEGMKDIAREAIRANAYKAGMNPDNVLPVIEPQDRSDVRLNSGQRYVPPIVAFCSSCGVSVRHPSEAYPVRCPACQTLIDPILDNPPEIS